MSQHVSDNPVPVYHKKPIDKNSIASKIPHHPRFLYSKPSNDMNHYNQNNRASSPEPCPSVQPPSPRPKNFNRFHGFTSHSHTVSSIPNGSLSPTQSRSLLQSFRKLTNRNKVSRASSSDLSQLEISSPVLVNHRTASEMFPTMIPSQEQYQDSPIHSPISCPPLSANSASYDSPTSSERNCPSSGKLESPAFDEDSSDASYNSDSTFEVVSITTRENQIYSESLDNSENSSRRLSKSLPAQSAAKLILCALSPPPPASSAPDPPVKSSSRNLSPDKENFKLSIRDVEQKVPLRDRRSKSSFRHVPVIKVLSEDLRDSTTVDVVKRTQIISEIGSSPLKITTDQGLLNDKYVMEEHLKFSPTRRSNISPKIASPIFSSLSQDQKINKTPNHEILTLTNETHPVSQDVKIYLDQKSYNNTQTTLKDIKEDSVVSQDSHSEDALLIRSLQAQNEFLAHELEWTKRLLASEIQERHRVVNDMQKSLEKFGAISSQACEKLNKVTEENRLLEREVQKLRHDNALRF